MPEYLYVSSRKELEDYTTVDDLTDFLYESLKPYEDPKEQISEGIDYAFSSAEGKGGFIQLAVEDDELVGALVMLNTGMKGYIPPNVLLYIAVSPGNRGQGIGGNLIKMAFEKAEGDIKLHVEHDNPAKRLYQRMGFQSKYAEMRYSR
ncbi:MAG: GNAT family N-acetyltransferase [Candidatus Aegiribacteria sp.]|nr:GNAT family N-acetyltransferase [Candidatus Aegiribacteria sp.]MBD3294850.1 GNAT family N-acetyltransferase [Candidatus Fermentibacteria bacterium]